MFTKVLCKGYVWEVSWRLNKLQHIDPQFLCRSAGLLNRGSWRPIALCWVLVLTTICYLQLDWFQLDWLQLDWLQLTEPVCDTSLYNCLTSICFLWTSNLHPIQPVHSQVYTLISSTGFTCSLIDGCVGGQSVTVLTGVWVVYYLCFCDMWSSTLKYKSSLTQSEKVFKNWNLLRINTVKIQLFKTICPIYSFVI